MRNVLVPPLCGTRVAAGVLVPPLCGTRVSLQKEALGRWFIRDLSCDSLLFAKNPRPLDRPAIAGAAPVWHQSVAPKWGAGTLIFKGTLIP